MGRAGPQSQHENIWHVAWEIGLKRFGLPSLRRCVNSQRVSTMPQRSYLHYRQAPRIGVPSSPPTGNFEGVHNWQRIMLLQAVIDPQCYTDNQELPVQPKPRSGKPYLLHDLMTTAELGWGLSATFVLQSGVKLAGSCKLKVTWTAYLRLSGPELRG